MSNAAAFRTDRIRMLIFVKRKEGMTHEEFSKYWIEQIGPLIASLEVFKKNILKYEQAHNSPSSGPLAQAFGVSTPDFDGTAILEAESLDKITETLTSEEYVQKVAPVEEKVFDQLACQILIQQLNTVIDG